MNPNHLIRTFPLLCAVLCLSALAARAEDTDALIAKGDQFDQRLQAKEALEVYLPANKLEPNNVKLLVCIARQYRHLMSDTSSKQEKLRLGNTSLEFASRAATLAPNNSEAQLSPAISLGKMLPFMGTKDQIKASPRIKAAVDRTLLLDPNNDNAWHILGRWNRVLANVSVVKRVLAKALYGDLPVTTNEAAEKCLLKAIEINPNRLMHYIELGRIYAQMGRKEEARKYIQKGMAMPNKEKDDPEMKEIGKQTLQKLG
ncbi:MAG TPA: tetratricopeptide repeat protein [Candidatus Udaeobacter sp.]|nr:tetratricopeptide repeat protein [Candidatus Udaeobacter sp.]